MRFDAEPELGWLALQYAARKLEPADIGMFEDRLADDQAAREAVAQAVELAHTTAFLHWDSAETSAEPAAEVSSTLPQQILPVAAPSAQTASVLAAPLPAAPVPAAPRASALPGAVNPAPAVHRASSTLQRTGPLGWLAIGLAAGLAIAAGPLLWKTPDASAPPVGNEVARDHISNVWAELMSQPLSAPEANSVAVEEFAVEQSPQDVTRETEDNLTIDWILSGLREGETNNDSSATPDAIN